MSAADGGEVGGAGGKHTKHKQVDLHGPAGGMRRWQAAGTSGVANGWAADLGRPGGEGTWWWWW